MHKSKLAGFIIDCKTGDLRGAAEFWGRALGMALHEFPESEGQKYIKLVDPNEQLHIEVQAVEHESRVHLDIESDDVEAEVKRLEALGAKLVSRVKSWCVMQAPTGQRFCVIRSSTPGFAENANRWGNA